MASPFQLFKILANMAGIVLAIAGVQIVWVNRRFLPRALRPALWREIGVLGCSAFYAYFAFYAIRAVLPGEFLSQGGHLRPPRWALRDPP